MASAVRAYTSAQSDGGSGAFTLAKPTGTTTGDVLIALQVNDDASGSGVTTTGWTQLGNATGASQLANFRTQYKIATSSEPTSYTFTQGGSDSAYAIIAISGATSDAPVYAATASTVTTSASATAPSVTATGPGLLINAYGIRTGSGGAPTSTVDATKLFDTNSSYSSLVARYETVTAGATETRKDTLSASTVGSYAISIFVADVITTLNLTKVGSTTVAASYVGSTAVSKMYVGSTQIFP